MPPKTLPPRNKTGQFSASARTGPPPSSLATPPVTLSQNPSSSPASPSRSISRSRSRSSSIASLARSHSLAPSSPNLSNIIVPPPDLDYVPSFAVPSRSAPPTIPAPNRSRSPSPSTSDIPTSLDSSRHNVQRAA